MLVTPVHADFLIEGAGSGTGPSWERYYGYVR